MVCYNKNNFSASFDAVNNCFQFKNTCLKVPFFQTKFERLVFLFHWREMFPDPILIFMGVNYICCIFKLFCLSVYFSETKNSMYWNIPVKRYPPALKVDEKYNKDKNQQDTGIDHEKEFKGGTVFAGWCIKKSHWEPMIVRWSVAKVVAWQLRDVGMGLVNPVNKPGDTFTCAIKGINLKMLYMIYASPVTPAVTGSRVSKGKGSGGGQGQHQPWLARPQAHRPGPHNQDPYKVHIC